MRYHNKPIVIEAEQYTGPISVDKDAPLPPAPAGVKWKTFDITFARYPIVTTIHGQETSVAPGDWIIREPDGVHYYPCKPDIFAARYEPMPHRVMVCGVDCHPGDAVCNNYCNSAPQKGRMAAAPPPGLDAGWKPTETT
jgi:hypothetical protein